MVRRGDCIFNELRGTQMSLPLRNQDACLWAVYWAAWAEFCEVYPNASDRQKADARVAIKQDLGLEPVKPARRT